MWLLPSFYLCSTPLAPSAPPARCVLHWDGATTHGRTTLALEISHPARARAGNLPVHQDAALAL